MSDPNDIGNVIEQNANARTCEQSFLLLRLIFSGTDLLCAVQPGAVAAQVGLMSLVSVSGDNGMGTIGTRN
jgi:hypothetical protein